jgi:hypothetical protein
LGRFLFIFLLLCWGYIVAFTKVLTIYQIYRTWIHPLHHSSSPSLSHSWNSFNRSLVSRATNLGFWLSQFYCVHMCVLYICNSAYVCP